MGCKQVYPERNQLQTGYKQVQPAMVNNFMIIKIEDKTNNLLHSCHIHFLKDTPNTVKPYHCMITRPDMHMVGHTCVKRQLNALLTE